MSNNIYPKTKHSIIKHTKIFLNLNETHDVTYDDVYEFKLLINSLLYDKNLSPLEISKKYNLNPNYNFSLFLSKCLGVKLRSCRDATNRYNYVNNKSITDEKLKYKNACKFKFSPWDEPKIIGYDLLSKYTFCKSQNQKPNTNYLHRDHMISISYGWENNISSSIISHPANCQIMTVKENCSKYTKCSITLDNLLKRIDNWRTG